MVYRIYSEKKKELAEEAAKLKNELRVFLGIEGLEDLRILNRYDVENIDPELFGYASKTVFSEPQADIATAAAHPLGEGVRSLRQSFGR